MASKNNNWYDRITRVFKSPAAVKRKIRDYRQPPTSTATEFFSKSQSFIYNNAVNSYGQYDRLARYGDFCFRGDTLVYTTQGIFPIEELAAGKLGSRFHVYSYDYAQKKVVIAAAHTPRIAKNGDKSTLVRITFDDGGHLDVTPDHKMILRDGSHIEAQDLKQDMALMPFYVRELNDGGYKMIYTMDKNRWKGGWLSEHIAVAEHFIRPLKKTEVVHHKDFNPKNNLIENLEIMTEAAHKRYHSKLNNQNKFGVPNESHSTWMFENNPVKRNDITYEKILELAIELDFSLKRVSEALGADNNVIKRRLRPVGFRNWADFSNRREEAKDKRTHTIIVKETRSPSIDDIIAAAPNCADIYQLTSILKCTENAVRRRLVSHGYGTWTEFRFGQKFENSKSIDPTYDDSLTFQDICNAYKSGMTRDELAAAVGSTHNKVATRIARAGFESYTAFEESYQNHKVANVIHLPELDIVYNITVEGHHNLAVGSVNPSVGVDEKTIRTHSMVFSRQSEMEYSPEIAAALDIYADETVSQDEKGNVLHIFSENRKIKTLLEELFYDTLNVDFNLRSWVRNVVKYGDFFLFNDIAEGHGVIQAFPIPVNEIEREEGYDPDDPQAVRYRWIAQNSLALENWQITHFRLQGNDAFLPYGSSIIEPARRIWRQLILIEDAMMVYRVVRSPERRIFYIDVGGVPPEEVQNYMRQQEASLRSNTIIDRETGRVDLRYNPLSGDEDYFIARRGAESGTEITSLAGGAHVSDIQDVEYIQKKLFAALKVPRAYLGYDESLSCLVGDVQVPLLDGRALTMAQLTAEYDDGKINWAYSCDPETGKFRPGKIVKAWKTKEVNELYEIELDDGHIITCTENHPFLCRDGVYRRADELIVNQSLMPLYRDKSKKTDGDFADGYDKVWCNADQKWKYTHRIVAACEDVAVDESYHDESQRIVHHVDVVRTNNRPDNLLKMGKCAHAIYHATHAENTILQEWSRDRLRNVMMTDAYKTKHRDSLKRAWDNDNGSRAEIVATTNRRFNKIKKMHAALSDMRASGQIDFSGKNSPNWVDRPRLESIIDVVRDGIFKKLDVRDTLQCSLAGIDETLAENGYTSWYEFMTKFDVSRRGRKIGSIDLDALIDIAKVSKTKREFYQNVEYSRTGFENYCARNDINIRTWFETHLNGDAYDYHNHKIVAIRKIIRDEPVAVYDLEIEKWHNFAVGNPTDLYSGVYVHNSKATLAQEDIRFSRTIQAIQKVILAELQHLAYIHLYANGYDGDDIFDFELRLTNPSSIAQQQKLELYNRKFEIIGNAMQIGDGKVFSQNYLLQNIMDMSKQQSATIQNEIIEDIQRNAAYTKIADGAVPESVGFSGSGGGFVPSAGGSDMGGADMNADMEGMEMGGESDDMGTDMADEPDDSPEEDMFDAQEKDGEILSSNSDAVIASLLAEPAAEDDEDAEDDDKKMSKKKPVQVNTQASKKRYNDSRKRRHGPATTHMPDMSKIVSIFDAQQDPYGLEANPLKNIHERPIRRTKQLDSVFNNLRRNFAAKKIDPKLLAETTEEDPTFEGFEFDLNLLKD